MASEADRKRIDKLPIWQQVKSAFGGGYDNEAEQVKTLKQSETDPELEAVRRRKAESR